MNAGRTAFFCFTVFTLIVEPLLSRDLGYPELKGEYPDNNKPGLKARLFAPGVISTEYHDDAAPEFSPDGKEIYFRIVGRRKGDLFGVIYYMRKEKGIWRAPEIAPFSGEFMDGAVRFTPDGNRIYFSSQRVNADGEMPDHRDLYYVERVDGEWRKVLNAGQVLNGRLNEASVEITDNGTLYYDLESTEGPFTSRMVRSRLEDGRYQPPEDVKGDFGSLNRPCAVAIAPDSGYMIITSPNPGHGLDLYVSFKLENGTWGKPENLGTNVNSKWSDKFPGISPDGRYLFFVSRRRIPGTNPEKKWSGDFFDGPQNIRGGPGGDIYWVSTDMIEYLRTADLDLEKIICQKARKNGVEAALEKYRELRQKHEKYYHFDEDLLNDVGDILYIENEIEMATTVLEYNFEQYPQGWHVYQNLKISLFNDDDEKFGKQADILEKETKKHGTEIESRLNNIGYWFLSNNFIDMSIRVFELNVRFFPRSANAYDSLGESFMMRGNKEAAMVNYRKSLELNPDNTNAVQMLRKLEEK